MATERRAAGGAGIVVVVLACTAAAAHGAGPVAPVALGDYEAAPVVDEGGTYSTGIFSVARVAGKRKLVPTEGFDAIFYPDVGKCDQLALPLLAATLRSSGPAASNQGEDPRRGRHGRVDWKGRWTKAKRVAERFRSARRLQLDPELDGAEGRLAPGPGARLADSRRGSGRALRRRTGRRPYGQGSGCSARSPQRAGPVRSATSCSCSSTPPC